MSSGPRHGFRVGYAAALQVVDMILPAVARVEIAGSLRRLQPDVGDVEIVAVPKMVEEESGDLFRTRTRVNLLERRVAELLAAGKLQPHPIDPKNGERYKKLWVPDPGIQLDLFIVAAAQWGPALLIRTGPAHFSAAMVTELRRKGLRCEELAIRRGAEVLDCPDERAFFALCERSYLAPECRGG